ncbi:Cytochrome c oxidase subunit CcoP [hydrothermal vent metagenome]|uniref:Cytochrome c oxidase subunit CcoP n=1 Tax=hydrothermal vent metagenome TaxID=652676 RepID=A0A1W1E9C3_9ZZZZ
MKTYIPSYLAIGIVLLYGLYNANVKKSAIDDKEVLKKTEYPSHDASFKSTQAYIVHVINKGSSSLHFKKEEHMEAGFVSSKDAEDVACYVRTLAGESCRYPKEASLLYSSNCAGCHGNDGKGLHGTYPDLTHRPLLGEIIQNHNKFP